MYYNDYVQEPIGGGNPYNRCIHCHRSVPEINGRLEGHSKDCLYRATKQTGGDYDRVFKFIYLGAPEEETREAEEDIICDVYILDGGYSKPRNDTERNQETVKFVNGLIGG